ncbi:MerR family transcriptional regulator [Mycolicibacterium brisbanense]|uniref:MerR family transcriptional regulator/peroxidase n=1 Tax=Mycolicibacterium brisbanense TaxID=146020 RepID=A0A100W0B9_9MYCO|nr:MerR family transcriptional regulator [Mycolicibacterium brisbanense]MCV7161710.1 redoxin family protein [Mycolicibacterium brisbanense]GAS89216.1 merR family transcriptional regulator/peroxidase [Mycolicibacterium brisbanense]
MKIGELARRANVSVKAVRYYEQLGLLTPLRQPNGYREYDDTDLRAVAEIRELAQLGIPPAKAGPFIECLDAGHLHSDECPASLAAYRDSIAEIDYAIATLTRRRAVLAEKLHQGATRPHHHQPESEIATMPVDFTTLPDDLPVPSDDGRAAHLPGQPMPSLTVQTSDGGRVDLSALPHGRTIIYLYPLTGRPGVDIPEGWDSIPGARGCSTEACSFRDHHDELRAAGAVGIYGMSSQSPEYQAEVVERLHLPFHMLSDPEFSLADTLSLPTFAASGHPRLYSRLTLVVTDGVIEHVFYPIFPPNTHGQQVLDWLRQNRM